MSIWLIVGITLALLGGILLFVLQIPVVIEKRKKKKKEPPPEPPKDWEGIAGRLEKRVHSFDGALKAAQNEIQDRDKRIGELTEALKNLRVQFDQEKIWREKEESAVEKEKKQERILQEELTRTRASLDQEQTARIKIESEHKEARRVREEQAAEIRQLRSRGMDLDRRLNEALKELKDLRDENIDLKKKKEDDEWVAKSDYKRLEAVLKRARWEAELFKRKVPEDQWPNALKLRQPSRAQDPQESASVAPAGTSAASVPGPSPSPAENAAPSVPAEPPPVDPPPPASTSEPAS